MRPANTVPAAITSPANVRIPPPVVSPIVPVFAKKLMQTRAVVMRPYCALVPVAFQITGTSKGPIFWFPHKSSTTARQRSGRLGRKLTKITQLCLRFVCLFHLFLNKPVQNANDPFWQW
jgi:hypothetical protein